MKIYHADFGWQGSVTVVAENAEQALGFMKQSNPRSAWFFDENRDQIVEHEIKLGLVLETQGDQ